MPLTDDPNDPRIARGPADEEPVEMADVYLVLSQEERDKGFVRPVRNSYIHAEELGGCGVVTRMAEAIAETYARDPYFYGATYCVGCSKHRPVGEGGEFYWDKTTEKVGT